MTAGEAAGRVDEAIWAQEAGEGPLVALVHGAMDRSGGMLRVRRVLQPTCRVLRYDRRGYARSLAAGPPVSFDQQVDDLAALLDGRPAVLAGHSFGGLICLALAERRPELVRAVVVYEAPMAWTPWWPGGRPGDRPNGRGAGDAGAAGPGAGDAGAVGPGDRDGPDAAEWFLRRMLGDAVWERLPAGMRAERRAEGPTLVAEMRSVRPPAPAPFDPRAVTVPVVVAHGTETRAHHRRAARELAERLPRGELRVVEGATHGAHLTHPDDFAGLVRRAIARADDVSET